MVEVYWESWPLKILRYNLQSQGILIDSLDDYKIECKKIELEEKNIDSLVEKEYQRHKNTIENEYNWLLHIQNILETNLENLHFFIRAQRKIRLFFLQKKRWKQIKDISDIEENEELYKDRFRKCIKNELSQKKYLLKDQENNYYWAIAELEVQSHLKKTYIDSKLINDFYKKLEKVVFIKWWSDIIQSLQIDHILINQKWIFLIETKNWSKEFEKKSDFPPLYQAKRHNHWFYYTYKNQLKYVLWFYPQIYSVLVRKQATLFQYHKNYYTYEISISELNHFIWWRQNNLDSFQVEKIFNLLLK